MMRIHVLPKAALTVAIGLLLTTGQAGAQALSQAELTRLVQAQALKIEQLEARLKAVEGGGSTSTAAAAPAPAAADPALEARVAKVEAAQAKAPKVSWSKGAPQFSNADGSFTFRPRGRLFVDASSTGGSDFADRNISGTEIRSVRLGAEGSYGRLGYVVEGDFADNEVAWKSVYASVDHRLFGTQAELSIGNRLNDRGLDGSSSTTNTPFADRNVVGTLILPQRGLFGVGLTERVFGQGWHASLSVAGNDLNNAGEDNDSLTVAARAHWNPLLSEAATVHLGAWAFHEDIPAGATGVLRSSAISGHFNDLVKIAPGALAGAERGTAYGVEAAGFFGSGWVSGEWGTRRIGGVGSAGRYDVDHSAWTVSGGVFLFGASPAYTAKSGTWGKVKVQDPVTSGGRGAWELRARYEDVDYDELPTGGTGHAWTVGTNWYLNDYARVMLDAVFWQTDNRSGAYRGQDEGYTFNTRFQVAF
ncbi:MULTISPECIES: porin [Pseudoxanthomonas]|uniref:Phosphate-selective porin OprO/OprP n=1 Tax=Pseudoxanthomonas winnipegensis TaxID=2480810 RepID=A0AAW8GFI5_9GAMM|nr:MULTISPECIES: porin [Pseudoxanthomonas]MDQ1120015.1 phosphate-selective porin OprO/OprP [Pseudoxanthomonas winnipegensis]MDQ1133218.1 phosphate-selective porin OprO/OprP [Pseudoxanthomonas winnipegensis]MDR6136781.1 phosphate-selective porin OprO/OprP [Pseudoxanthomonas sp. SORGH_AS_0997]